MEITGNGSWPLQEPRVSLNVQLRSREKRPHGQHSVGPHAALGEDAAVPARRLSLRVFSPLFAFSLFLQTGFLGFSGLYGGKKTPCISQKEFKAEHYLLCFDSVITQKSALCISGSMRSQPGLGYLPGSHL